MIGTLALGLLVGLVMALTGAGGGVLAVPLLVFTTGLAVQEVSPIGLLAVGLAATLGAALGLRAGQVRYKAAMLMGFVGLLLSPLGFWVAQRVDTKVLGLAFAAVLLWVAFNAFRSSGNSELNVIDAPPDAEKSKCPCIRNPVTGRFIWTWPCARALIFSGATAGFLSGLLGVGGGFVLVPALQRFTNLTVQSITVTSLAVIAIVSSFGVLNSMNAGAFNYEIGITFSAAALTGMLGGRLVSDKLPTPHLKKAFGAMCLVVAGLMLIKNLA
ncbi:sulfite exporter TauE/SafE family protein [Limnobacter parvus]|uniref:Probable membrane transporter protein n=1 Tax=Limnobacter parvus TaxID=2939690 RepID=A0ABT1XJU4_9BURK|nr:sulfite exporter TauE/SafE family protein [Limnobacter parvus]MCR2746537.1 sulfite exporter TauE/SafE family protein [Limnobacter parvus]